MIDIICFALIRQTDGLFRSCLHYCSSVSCW